MIIVGSDKVGAHGAHGAEKHVPIFHFFYWHECETFLRKMKGCKICGIVDSVDANRIQTVGVSDGSSGSGNSNKVRAIKDISKSGVRFDSSTAFIVTGGSRRSLGGLTAAQEAICDELFTLHFPRGDYECVLDYDVYVAIILERYSSTMKFHQRSFVGEKFFINDDGMKHMKVTKLSTIVGEYIRNNNATDIQDWDSNMGTGQQINAYGAVDFSEGDNPSLDILFPDVEY